MIIIALGANVRGSMGSPARTLRMAEKWLDEAPLRKIAISGLYRSAPFGLRAQPPFVNSVAVVETALSARDLLRHLAMLEGRAGRRRGAAWGPRALDLDLIDFHGRVQRPPGMGRLAAGRAAHSWQRRGLTLPHPGLAQRSFVLMPLAEIAPAWRHPVTGRSAAQMLAMLPGRRRAACRPMSRNVW